MKHPILKRALLHSLPWCIYMVDVAKARNPGRSCQSFLKLEDGWLSIMASDMTFTGNTQF